MATMPTHGPHDTPAGRHPPRLSLPRLSLPRRPRRPWSRGERAGRGDVAPEVVAHTGPAPDVALGKPSEWSGAARVADRLLINRNFALLWGGQAISTIGDTVLDTALVLWIGAYVARGQSWGPLAISVVLLAAAIPRIAVGPLAAVFADRWDKRLTMLWMDALSAVLVAFLVLATDTRYLPFLGNGRIPLSAQLGAAGGAVILVTICTQFYQPARFAMITYIVDDDQRTQAISMSQALQGFAVILGPPIAAVLVFGLGVQWALLVDALSFVASYLAVLAMRVPRTAGAPTPGEGEMARFRGEFVAGLRYVWDHRVPRTILISVVLTWLGFGALQVLGYFFVTQNLRASPELYGFLGSAFGLGAAAGAVGVTVFGKRLGLVRVVWVALVLSGAFIVVLAHLTLIGPVLAAAFVFGVSSTAIIVAEGPLVLHFTPKRYVGRVSGVITSLGQLAALISVVIAGWLVSTVVSSLHASVFGITFGPVDTVLTGVGVLAIAGGLYARINLRGVGVSGPAVSAEDKDQRD